MKVNKKEWLNIILLTSDWELYHTKDYILAKGEVFKDWSDILLIQLPVSLLVHFFTNFKRKILGLIRGRYRTFKINENICVFTPIILFHYLVWNKIKIAFLIDRVFFKIQLSSFLKNHYPGVKIIQWMINPIFNILVNELRYNILIYDYQDNFNYDFEGRFLPVTADINHCLIRKSDLVFCTARAMYQDSLKFNRKTYYLTNGNNYQLISSQKIDTENELSKLGKPIIGYIGGMRNWLDYELVEYIMENLKNCYFVFIGIIYKNSINEVNKLKRYKNFLYIKYLPLAEMTGYLKNFSIGIIPFKINEFSKGIFPNKFFEYMAAGVPIVTTELTELENFKNIIWISRDKQQFLDNCKSILDGNNDEKLKYYSDLAEENSWFNKAQKVNKIIKSYLNGKVYH